MAASTLRVSRRPKGSPANTERRRSLTAASQIITDPQKQLKSSTFGATRQDWQNEAWELSEIVGELSYYVSWRSNSCSRVKIIASEIDPDTGLPTGGLPTDDDGELLPESKKVAEIVRSVAGGPLGQAELIKRATECLTIPGELWVVVLSTSDGTQNAYGEDNTTDKWYAVTRDEIKTKTGGGAEIELPDGTKHDFKSGTDVMVRLWNPRARRAREATSPVKACLEPLREIVRTSQKIKNAAKSRMINNGVLFLPSELSLPGGQGPIAEDQANVPGAPVPIITGVPAADALANLLFQTGVAASENENSQAALLPVMATVPGEYLKNVLHLKFGNDITEVEIKTRVDAITRLAMGLDVSPERLLGIGGSANHWSAWQIGDEDVQLHIKPVMETIVKAIYQAIVRPIFIKAGIDPDKYILWYDASGLTADPDLTDEAIKAHELGALRSDALRQLLNVGEENGYDLTTIEGCQVFARDAITKDPTLIAQYWSIIAAGTPELEAIDIPQPALPAAPGDNEDDPDDESGASKQKEPDTEDDAEAVINSSAELILAERLLVNRALDLAGKRRFSVSDREQKARLRGFAPHDYHRVMGPVRESEIPKLIKGWDSALLADDVIQRLGVAGPLRAAVLRAVQRELTSQVVDVEVSV